MTNNNYQEAEIFLMQCSQTSTTNSSKAACSNLLGFIYLEKKDFTKAIESYSAAHKFNPNNPAYLNNLATTYYKEGSYDKLIPFLLRCQENDLNIYNKEMQLNCAEKLLGLEVPWSID
jgi:Flp pilus assembly protein TadD